MLEVRIVGVRVRLCFGFFAAVTAYYYVYHQDQSGVAAALTACLLHELGHLAAMLLFGERPRALYLYAGGIKLIPPRRSPSRGRQAVILSAGCAVNFLLARISYLIGAERLMYVNLAVGILNLLPFSALDGGRLAELCLPYKVRRAAAAVTLLLMTAAVVILGGEPMALLVTAFAAAAEFFM